ncbi:MAG: hypothetical protein ABI591_25460 [Kofleriaceae bacterium]
MRHAITLVIAITSGLASASPVHDRVLTVPTAELPAAGDVIASGALDRHGGLDLEAGIGLGGLGEVELAIADGAARDGNGLPVERETAAFRMGAPEDAWFVGQPAIVLGVRATIGTDRATSTYVVASRRIAFVSLHLGGSLEAVVDKRPIVVRPLAGFELRPPAIPKTTLLADLSWQPVFAARPTEQLAFSWGVRYQALRWATIELAVRHDESSFGDPDVFVRVTGMWATSPH